MRHASGKRNHHCPRSDGDGHAESTMCRKAASAHIIIVHAWKVVVDERIRVNDLDGCSDPRCVASPSRRAIGREHEHPAETLAAPRERVTDGAANRLGKLGSTLVPNSADCRLDCPAVVSGKRVGRVRR